ncbi:MAG: hypothetical protein SFZ03_06080, partial [Candidatus Melainabacteria bacterium]|nr:hypothetical protein [Candidatus Melainabacteria bacterium]
ARPWIGHGSSAISHLDGRVFFGQRATGNFYTWHSTTGLSTLVSNVSNPGAFEAIAVDQTTGRVFWGQDSGTPGNIWTWHASTGLSVLVTGQSDPGDFGNIKAVPGGAYWGTQGAGTARMYYWNSNDGLQTIGFSLTSPGRPRSMNVYQAGQRLYFGEQSATGSFFTFSPGNCQNRGY